MDEEAVESLSEDEKLTEAGTVQAHRVMAAMAKEMGLDNIPAKTTGLLGSAKSQPLWTLANPKIVFGEDPENMAPEDRIT